MISLRNLLYNSTKLTNTYKQTSTVTYNRLSVITDGNKSASSSYFEFCLPPVNTPCFLTSMHFTGGSSPRLMTNIGKIGKIVTTYASQTQNKFSIQDFGVNLRFFKNYAEFDFSVVLVKIWGGLKVNDKIKFQNSNRQICPSMSQLIQRSA